MADEYLLLGGFLFPGPESIHPAVAVQNAWLRHLLNSIGNAQVLGRLALQSLTPFEASGQGGEPPSVLAGVLFPLLLQGYRQRLNRHSL